MNKAEIKKFISGIKIYVNGKSEEIQKKLFSLGCLWFGGDKPRINYINKPFLFINDTLELTYSDDMLYFEQHGYREITAEEILALEPTEQYRPFNTKEECWEEMTRHQPFGWIKNENGNIFNIIAIINDSIKVHECFTDYYTLCERFKFMDGAPFGIKEE